MLIAFLLACTSAEKSVTDCDQGWFDPYLMDTADSNLNSAEIHLNWENYGEAFFQTWCQSCHSRTTPQRLGAPPNMNFDLPSDIEAWREAIVSSVIVSQRMPKGGGISDLELSKLEHFLACFDDENEAGEAQ